MCGIAGIFQFNESCDPQKLYAKCSLMINKMRHRGPDDLGVETVSGSPFCTLGQARLAIIDLSEKGHQPMKDPESGNYLVFNGEIYNYRELREELKKSGHSFYTDSDTEVILKSYAQWNEKCVEHLNGMFAFAIWDNERKQLYIARDRMGIKPFYYYWNGNILYFASEVRALLETDMIERVADVNGLHSYFAYGSLQEPYTLIRNVVSLPPAHFMIIKDGIKNVKKYWEPQLKLSNVSSLDLQKQINESLFNAVKSRMIADVPLGAFLSGGIDSTVIVALMRKANSGKIKTFSIVFDDDQMDEREYSALAAQRIGTDHAELELTGKFVKSNLHNALDSFDQPSVDGLNTWFVSKVTKEAGLTVALSGLGGDEIFAGYNEFKKARMIENYAKKLRKIPGFIGRLVNKYGYSEKIRKAGELVSFPESPYFLSRQLFSELQIENILPHDIEKKSRDWFPDNYRELMKQVKACDQINRISWLEASTYMLSTLLRDTDQMSMSHALEVRVPLIDYKLVELMLTVPGYMKLDSRTPKHLLVNGAEGAIPDECIYRPKQGFALPFDKWFATEIKGELEEFFLSGGNEFFSASGLAHIWHNYQNELINWSRIWSVYILQYWLKKNEISLY